MIILRNKKFSNKKEYYMSYDKPVKPIKKSQDKILTGAGALIGSGLGYISGKNHKLKRSSLGAAVGAIAGLNGSVLKRLYEVNHQSKKKTKIKAGDIIKFTKKGPQLGQHYAVYDGDGGIIDYGSEGIRYTSLDKALKNSEAKKVKAELVNKKHTKKELEKKAKSLKEKYTKDNYHFTDNNCEHFARELSTNNRFSIQGDDLTGKMAKIVSKKKDPYGRN
jgi:hypothetical protein